MEAVKQTRAIIILATFSLVFQMGISMNNLLVPLYTRHLGAEIFIVGIVSASRVVVSTFLGMPMGLVYDRLGRRKTALLASLIAFSASLILSVSTETWHVLFGWAIAGLAFSTYRPFMMALVSEAAGRKRLATIYGIFNTIESIGAAIGPFMAGLVASDLGFSTAFLFSGAIFGLAIVLIPVLKKIGATPVHKETGGFSLKEVDWVGISPGLLGVFSVTLAYGVAKVFVPIYGTEVKLGIAEVGLIMTIGEAGGAILRTPLGMWSDKSRRRLRAILAGILIMILSVPFLTLYPSSAYLALLMVVVSAGHSLTFVAARAHIAEVTQMKRLGLMMGLFSSFVNGGYAVGPSLAGLIISTYDFAIGFYATGIIALLLSVVIYFLGRKR